MLDRDVCFASRCIAKLESELRTKNEQLKNKDDELRLQHLEMKQLKEQLKKVWSWKSMHSWQLAGIVVHVSKHSTGTMYMHVLLAHVPEGYGNCSVCVCVCLLPR